MSVVVAVGLMCGPVMSAPAAVADRGGPDGSTEVRPATLRISEGENRLFVFVNKSRADLCTPERIAYEHLFLEWANSEQDTEPPAEPAASQQGVKPVRLATRTVGDVTTSTVIGPNLPVEVWRLEDDVDGTDCTGTDGPGAAFFGRGTMTWRGLSLTGRQLTVNDTSVDGRIVDTSGQPYHYLIRYQFRQVGDHDPVFTPTVRLTPTR